MEPGDEANETAERRFRQGESLKGVWWAERQITVQSWPLILWCICTQSIRSECTNYAIQAGDPQFGGDNRNAVTGVEGPRLAVPVGQGNTIKSSCCKRWHPRLPCVPPVCVLLKNENGILWHRIVQVILCEHCGLGSSRTQPRCHIESTHASQTSHVSKVPLLIKWRQAPSQLY